MSLDNAENPTQGKIMGKNCIFQQKKIIFFFSKWANNGILQKKIGKFWEKYKISHYFSQCTLINYYKLVSILLCLSKFFEKVLYYTLLEVRPLLYQFGLTENQYFLVFNYQKNRTVFSVIVLLFETF